VATAIQNRTSEGITVHVVSDAVRKGNFDPWTQPIVIRVDAEHRYYLHSKLIPLQNIPATLAQAFKTRPNWTVYVEGDLDSNYGDMVQAADAVRSARGRVVLLTYTIR
jgi:biopolymer transport protein ExbD